MQRDCHQQNICRVLKSPWVSALHLAKKKNGDWRPCGDFCNLNSQTIHSLPNTKDVTFLFHGKKVFLIIDLTKTYLQIPVHPDDIPKTVVVTPFDLEFLKMPFGLRMERNFPKMYLQFTQGFAIRFYLY